MLKGSEFHFYEMWWRKVLEEPEADGILPKFFDLNQTVVQWKFTVAKIFLFIIFFIVDILETNRPMSSVQFVAKWQVHVAVFSYQTKPSYWN